MKNPDASSVHWSQQREKAAGYWHLKFILILFRILPVIVLRVLAFPVGFFYFLLSKKARTESRRFLARAASFAGRPQTAKRCRSFFGPLRHIVSFSLNLVEKLETWSGKFPYRNLHYHDDAVKELIEGLENGKGAFLIASHLGNVELLRGFASYSRTEVSKNIPVTAIMNVDVSSHFTRMIKELNSQSAFDVISANEIGPHTAAILEEKLAAGEMVTSAGDRTPGADAEKSILIPFLGEDAPFTPGIFYLAVLLNVPVYFVFALRRGELSLKPEYDMYVHKYVLPAEFASTENGASSGSGASKGSVGRKDRQRVSSDLARSFAGHLERYCKEQPFQWYNFYDFWSKEVR